MTKWSFLESFTLNVVEEIKKAIKRGVEIQIVTQKPENNERLQRDVQTLMKKSSLKIKYVQDLPSSLFALFDDKEVTIAVSTTEVLRETSFLWSNNSGLIKLAQNYFETIWNQIKEERVRLERYRSFIEVTGELGWNTNAYGEVVEDLPAFRKFTGQTCNEIKGWCWSEAVHPNDVEHTKRVWKEAIETRKRYEVEYRLRRHDGVYRYFMARGVPVFDEDGNVKEWMGTCVDITEKKQLDEEIQKSYRLNALLLDSIPYPAMLIRCDRTVIASNKIALQMGVKIDKPCWREFGKSMFLRDRKDRCWFCMADEAMGENAGKHRDVEAFGRLWDTWWIPVERDLFLHFAIDIAQLKGNGTGLP